MAGYSLKLSIRACARLDMRRRILRCATTCFFFEAKRRRAMSHVAHWLLDDILIKNTSKLFESLRLFVWFGHFGCFPYPHGGLYRNPWCGAPKVKYTGVRLLRHTPADTVLCFFFEAKCWQAMSHGALEYTIRYTESLNFLEFSQNHKFLFS